ncbi:DUF4360 domain-containing protein [Thiolinea disciformis]|uniref:DUF4360 domain-containing protein n=1 Tax=Thiolinea disciformis TaxID=125614 RepID=UPI00037A3D98|nr:DUF4360 domain-containing protein [Thiolinea disciformis]
MRINYFLIALSCSLLAACGDKSEKTESTSATVVNTANASGIMPPNTPVTSPSTTPATPPAPPPVTLDKPAIAGTACPVDSVTSELQANQDSLKINIPEIVIGIKPGLSGNVNCNIAIPVRVAQGYQVAVMPLRFSGTFNSTNLKILIQRSYFLAGDAGITQTSTLTADANKQFDISDTINPDDASHWTKCGEDANLRANVRLMTRSGQGEAKVTIQSTDTADPRLFKLVYRACQ